MVRWYATRRAEQMSGFDTRNRAGFTVAAEILTWDLCVFRVTGVDSARRVFIQRRGSAAERFLDDLDQGRLDGALESALARPGHRRLRRPPRGPAWPGPHVGIEHEFRVLDEDGRQVDFGQIIHGLGIDGVRADPADPNAYRCSWGGVVTCDGREAELATAPVAVRPGFVEKVVASAHLGRTAIDSVLPPDHRLEGFSTHLNVSVPARHSRRIALRYARTFAPPMMLLLDRRTSPGLLVRPRPGRLELGGEFVCGEPLRAAVAFAVGSALAARTRIPGLVVESRLEAAQERFGWYVDRTAFGGDLYAEGRHAELDGDRGVVTAGKHLCQAWALARSALGDRAGALDLVEADEVVAGTRPLPSEVTST